MNSIELTQGQYEYIKRKGRPDEWQWGGIQKGNDAQYYDYELWYEIKKRPLVGTMMLRVLMIEKGNPFWFMEEE